MNDNLVNRNGPGAGMLFLIAMPIHLLLVQDGSVAPATAAFPEVLHGF